MAGTQGAGTITVVTTKERLHKLVDELTEQEADDALRYLAERHDDPVIAAFRDARLLMMSRSARRTSERSPKCGRTVPRAWRGSRYAEIKRKHASA